MARAIWSGTISFGLLNVPVKMYSAVSRKTIRFNELRESDSSRVRHKRVAEADGKEVEYDEIVKGYEISPDHYVTFSRDELEELTPAKTRAIEIQDFVDIEDIDPTTSRAPLPRPRRRRREADGFVRRWPPPAGGVAASCFETRSTARPADGQRLTLTLSIRLRGGARMSSTMCFRQRPPGSTARAREAEKLIASLAGNLTPQVPDIPRHCSHDRAEGPGKRYLAETTSEPTQARLMALGVRPASVKARPVGRRRREEEDSPHKSPRSHRRAQVKISSRSKPIRARSPFAL